MGEPADQQGHVSARVQQLVTDLQAAGFNASASVQIQKDVWYKLWGNMTVNPISAITGATTDLILKDDLVRDFVSKVMLEASSITFETKSRTKSSFKMRSVVAPVMALMGLTVMLPHSLYQTSF